MDMSHDALFPAAVRDTATLLLERWLDSHEQAIFGYLCIMLGDRDRAADCLQDTFLRAYVHLAAGKPLSAQWLYTVARHRAVDELRHQRRVETRAQIPETETVEGSVSEEGLAVQQALMRLSPDDREILYLAEVDGFTSNEIGQMLGIKPGTVRMRLHRAHLRFREIWEAPE